jgi:hypothetical protein
MRRTTVLLAVAALALAGCSSGGEPEAKTVTVTATPPPATPSLSQSETARLCSVAVSEAAPGWDDWNIELGGWEDDPRTPEVCKGLADEEWPPRGNRAFQDAWIDGLQLADDPRAGS